MRLNDGLPLLGVDIGGVIIERAGGDEADDTHFPGEPSTTPPVEHALEVLTELNAAVFPERVVLISKASPRTITATRDWLAHHRFHQRTSIGWHQLHFVAKRPDKGPLCAELGVTHFVDDTPEVLDGLTTVAHRYLFVGHGVKPGTAPVGVAVVRDWPTLLTLLRQSVATPG